MVTYLTVVWFFVFWYDIGDKGVFFPGNTRLGKFLIVSWPNKVKEHMFSHRLRTCLAYENRCSWENVFPFEDFGFGLIHTEIFSESYPASNILTLLILLQNYSSSHVFFANYSEIEQLSFRRKATFQGFTEFVKIYKNTSPAKFTLIHATSPKIFQVPIIIFLQVL